jgi:choline dehydrogenase-like flavoprotein
MWRDAELRVPALQGLRVVDAPSCRAWWAATPTTQPVVMIAEKAADMIKAVARGAA